MCYVFPIFPGAEFDTMSKLTVTYQIVIMGLNICVSRREISFYDPLLDPGLSSHYINYVKLHATQAKIASQSGKRLSF